MSADKAKFAAIEKRFAADFGEAMAGVGLDAWAKVQLGMSPYDALVAAMEQRRAFAGIDSAILRYARESLRVGWAGGITQSDVELDRFLLKTSYGGAKVPLIKTLKKKTYMDAAKSTLSAEMQAGYNWQKATKALESAAILRKPDLPQYIERAVSAARKATKSAKEAKEFEKVVRQAQAQVDKLAANGAPTTFLKKAYQNVLQKAESGSAEQLQAAIDRGVKAKMQYEAQRIARTEGFAAYGQARVEEAVDDPDITALKFTLSSRHHHYDQCDIIANSNLYGLGAGVYPADKAPRLPIHPNGMSYYSPVSVRKVSREAAAGAEFDRKEWEKETARRGLSPSQSQPPQETKLILSKEIK